MKSRSYTYFLPMLADEMFDPKNNLKEVYLKDDEYPELEDRIFILYKFVANNAFLRFEEEVKWSVYFDRKYDVGEDYVMMVFKVPDQFLSDYDLLLEGKFSKISKGYKEKIIEFHELTEYDQVTGILYKKEFAFINLERKINEGLPEQYWTRVPREQEAASLIEVDKEILHRNKVPVLSY